MSDNPAVQVAAKPVEEPKAQVAAAETTPASEEPYDKARAMELIEKLRAENKALKPFEKKAVELEALRKQQEEKDLTELQKAQKQIAELTAQTKAHARSEMQRQVAKEYKLPDAIAELLPGDDIEAMKAKAAELSKALPHQPNISPTNPAGNAQETEAQKRDRLLGGNKDIWKGGGVQWVNNP